MRLSSRRRSRYEIGEEVPEMGFVVAVAVVIFNGDRALAMRRSMQKDAAPGAWETVSGRVEAGEQPIEAAMREVREECGLEIELDPRPVDAYVARRLGEPMLLLIYGAEWLAGEVCRSDEHDEHAWMTPAELRAVTPFARLADAVERAAAARARAGSVDRSCA